MHSFDGKGCTIHYNSDLSGDVKIQAREGTCEGYLYPNCEIEVPGQDLFDFIVSIIQFQLISAVEDLDVASLAEKFLQSIRPKGE